MNMTLKEFFEMHPKVAIAFSGGVDSSYLLYAATQYAKDVTAYYVKGEFQPEFEFEDAVRLAEDVGTQLKVLHLSILSNPTVCENPWDRCYHCKTTVFTQIMEAARADGYAVLLDGTNASDDEGDRPGMKALRELSVLSPLRLCGLTKSDVRALSQQAGLFTWDKPAYACLATRIPTGEMITAAKLATTEEAEGFLFSLGFTDFRVRMKDGHAKIQMKEQQMPLLLQHRRDILDKFSELYESVVLDLEAR